MYKYAKVIVNVSHSEVDTVYSYEIPKKFSDKVEIGMRVIVPFGYGNKNIEGYVVNLINDIDIPEKKIKYILDIPDEKKIFTLEMLSLAKYMREKYYCNFIDCLNTMKPQGIKFKTEYVIELIEETEKKLVTEKGKEVIKYLKEKGLKVLEVEIIEIYGINIKRTLKSLENKNIVKRTQLSKVKDLTQRVKVAYLNYDINNFYNVVNSVLEKEDSKSKIVKYLLENKKGRVIDLVKMFSKSKSPIDTLEKYGIIKIEVEEVLRNINYSIYKDSSEKKVLTDEQDMVCNYIFEKIDSKSNKPIVIHGVTGSGKTEIYIQLLKKVLKEGKEGILLVPEIALTPQTVSRLVNVFGDKVGITHSRLSAGERYDEWKKARDGQVSIMIGARSAVFSPFKNLRIIIIDEEHESTYRSETTPKYDTIEVARKRMEISKGTLVLGSATPSINTYYKCETNEYEMVKLNKRVNNSFPNIEIVDMREQLKNGNKSIFSCQLQNSIEKALKNKEQVILFLNKRGASNFVSCRSCGYVCTCDNCAVSYTYHSYKNNLMCHYCGKEIENPKNCPMCGSKYIKHFGIGTQKVENEVKKIFDCEVVRMDLDTVGGKDSHSKLLEKFRTKKADVLVGTQMIAKGLDFENVTVVGIIAGDLSINNGDFKSGENTFQLLTQVSGRAGRGSKKGEVYIQTYNPEHYSIIKASENDYEGFYKQEIGIRRAMNYPPFSNIFVILVIGSSEKEVINFLNNVKSVLEINNIYEYEILNPTPAIVSKIKNRYRWKIIIKGEDEKKIKNFAVGTIKQIKKTNNVTNLNISLNLNPTVIP